MSFKSERLGTFLHASFDTNEASAKRAQNIAYSVVIYSATTFGFMRLVDELTFYVLLVSKRLSQSFYSLHLLASLYSNQFSIIFPYVSYGTALGLLLALRKSRSTTLSVSASAWCLGVGLYPVGIALAIVIYWAILAVFAINYTFALPEIATITVFRALLCTILVPLVDEVIFRGWLFGRLRAVGLRDELVIAITSVVWAMLSAFALLAFIQVTINVLLGCMLGYARSRTNSIVAPIFLHSSFNIVTTLLIDIKL